MRDKFIKVYNGVGALIATFSCDTADEIKDQHEQIYNPHVSIDEDNSTASFDVFQESDVWAKISGEDKIYEIDGRRYFIYGDPAEIADTNMIKVTLRELWYELDTKFLQAYNVDGELEAIGEYSVLLMPFSDATLYINGEPKTNPYTKENLGYYIWTLLQGTGYSLAFCDVIDDTYDPVNLLSAFELDTEGLTVLENLNLLRKLTDCIYKWDTINKQLYVYSKDNATSEINKWQGYEIREGVNITSIEKRKNTNIVTRVIPYGYDNLVISSVNSGLLYLDDNSYSPKVYAKIIHNPDIHTPHALKVWAQKELAKMCRPTFQYEVEFTWRQDEDYAHETFALYDIVRVVYYDKEIGQEVTDNQRIISLEYDVWKKSAFNGVLGSKPRWVQNLKQSVVNGVRVGQVLSSSGTISTGSIYYGSGENKKRLSSFLGGVESTIAQIEATADEDRANVELISLYTNAAKGVKTVQEYTPETWDNDYIYYVSQGTYTGYWRWEVSEWVETQPMNSTLATVNATAARAAANVELLAKYTSSVDEIIEVENTSGQGTWDTNAIYYVSSTDKFYKYSGSSWGIVDQMSTMVASISAKSSENESKISLVVEKVDGVDVIKAASIVAAINDAGSTITINADKINFDGFATFMRSADYLSAGKTTIDGGKITANSITATQIDTSGLVAESIVVMNEEETKTLFSANSATNTVFIDGTVIAGVLASSNFAYTSGNYSSAGTSLNLANGVIITPQFAIDSSGNAYFKGTIYSDNICNNVNSDATSFGEIIFEGGTSGVGQYSMQITDANDVLQKSQ
ncbi:MAG TPA: hypothetical protein PK673_06465, partial [Paludibacteraceae bacterium]|nr:hypothetical protein [Paludibacteraceae bacterium]